jgi:hypothetical protein
MRDGYVKPYVGVGFALWLPDVALMVAIPAVLLGLVSRWTTGVAFGVLSFVFVAWSYPALRGESLLHFYEAIYLAAYLVCALLIFWRSTTRKLNPQEGLLLLYGLLGVVGVILVVKFGVGDWRSVLIPNGAAYLATLVVAVLAACRPRTT